MRSDLGKDSLEYAFPCALCDAPLQASGQVAECSYCGRKEPADYLCPNGHYICEQCRISTPEQVAKKTSKHVAETDPVRIADLLMKHPAIPMHGTEHHYLAACALLAAIRNLGALRVAPAKIDKAVALAKIPPLGSCALWGACGAAIGVGAALSAALNANIMSGQERTLVLKLVSEALGDISRLGGPRCCKASVMLALAAGKRLLNKKFGAAFDEEEWRCDFSDRNREDCLGNRCPFFRR